MLCIKYVLTSPVSTTNNIVLDIAANGTNLVHQTRDTLQVGQSSHLGATGRS